MPNSPVATPTNDNKHLYNGGSEWQNDYSNLPDYYQTFFRNYDAAIGRFVGVDPMPEATESMSVYHYAGNNPILFNDPDGSNPAPGGISNFSSLSQWREMYNNYWRTGIGGDIQENIDNFYMGITSSFGPNGGSVIANDGRWDSTSQSGILSSNYVTAVNQRASRR